MQYSRYLSSRFKYSFQSKAYNSSFLLLYKGNTRVITQGALQTFQNEMGKVMKDPYKVSEFMTMSINFSNVEFSSMAHWKLQEFVGVITLILTCMCFKQCLSSRTRMHKGCDLGQRKTDTVYHRERMLMLQNFNNNQWHYRAQNVFTYHVMIISCI